MNSVVSRRNRSNRKLWVKIVDESGATQRMVRLTDPRESYCQAFNSLNVGATAVPVARPRRRSAKSYCVHVVSLRSVRCDFVAESLEEAQAFADGFNRLETLNPKGFVAIVDVARGDRSRR